MNLLFDAASGVQTEQSIIQNVILLAVAFLFLYFVFWRPDQKRRQSLQKMRDSLQIGQTIHAMGIVGKVVRMNEATIIIESANSEIEVLKTVITYIEPTVEVTPSSPVT